jgi:predicted N-acetyltransferase YhbS
MNNLISHRIVPIAGVTGEAVEALLDSAFGTDRRGRTAYRMREGVSAIPALSFAALDDDRLLGTLQSWPVALETDGQTDGGFLHKFTLVGPVAVDPALQRSGIGRALMTHLMERAAETGHDALVMIGDPEYYGRFFGFSADATQHWRVPGPVERHRLLAHITRKAGIPLDGAIIPDPAFASVHNPA